MPLHYPAFRGALVSSWPTSLPFRLMWTLVFLGRLRFALHVAALAPSPAERTPFRRVFGCFFFKNRFTVEGSPLSGEGLGGRIKNKDSGVASFEAPLTLNKASLLICFLAHKPCLLVPLLRFARGSKGCCGGRPRHGPGAWGPAFRSETSSRKQTWTWAG